MTDADQHVAKWLAVFSAPDTGVADLLGDRHPADAVAFTIVEPDLTSQDLTFGDLRAGSARLATGLAGLGVGRGDRVATLLGRSAELVMSLLAIWRLGAVHVPLFTAFAPPAIATRITGNGTKVVLTDPRQRVKLTPGTVFPMNPEWTVVTTGPAFDDLLDRPPLARPVAVGGDGTIVELFTSGTTGPPKAVPIPLRALAAMRMYQEYGLDHQANDVFWNAADPGWAYGLYHAVLGPLCLGHRGLLVRGGFSPELTWRVLARFGVTNFTAGPTVYRALRNHEPHPPPELRLRHCSSAGEPLDPDTVEWARTSLGVPILDHYGQTELGMAVANAWHPDLRREPRPGSMGHALPGWRLEVLRPDTDEIAAPGEPGRLAVDVPNSPLMWFTGYRDAPERTAERFSADGIWYLTGDAATRADDGSFAFTSRDDDIILMAGYRIGPFDVESVLLQHDQVTDAAVVGAPDQLRGEVLIAYVVLRPGAEPTGALVTELQQLVKTRFAAHAYPRRIHFVPELPRTPSGKVQRFRLRQLAKWPAADRN